MTTPGITIRFEPTGKGHCLYTEDVDLSNIGRLQVRRATHVEFCNARQAWQVRDLDGSTLYCSPFRATCLAWERQFLGQR